VSAEELRIKPINIFKPDSGFMRDEVRAIWTILIIWALESYGFVLLLWAIGTKGSTTSFADEAAWADRVNLDPSALPGASGLTSAKFLGFPFHWFWTAIGMIVVFILLVIIFNVWFESIEKKHGIEFRERDEIIEETRDLHKDEEGGTS